MARSTIAIATEAVSTGLLGLHRDEEICGVGAQGDMISFVTTTCTALMDPVLIADRLSLPRSVHITAAHLRPCRRYKNGPGVVVFEIHGEAVPLYPEVVAVYEVSDLDGSTSLQGFEQA